MNRLLVFAMVCIAVASCGRGPGAGHPDLVVDSPAVSDDRPAAGARFTFSATVRNAGRGSAAATTLRVYRANDATATPSETEVRTVAVQELPASEHVIVPVKLNAPSSYGTSYYRACVDAVDSESDTANNCSDAVPITVQERPASPRPELVLETPEVSDANPTTGEGFTLSVTVRNSGSAPAPETAVRFHRSTDQEITPSKKEVGTDTIADLAASGSRVASVELTAPSSPGTYYYGACVDAIDGQSGTANGCSASVRVTVREPPAPTRRPPGPDLEVEDHGVGEFSPTPGGFWLVVVYLRNAGDSHASETWVRYYRSTDRTITRSDKQIGTAIVSALAPSQREYVGAYVRTTREPGTYYYGVCVDVVTGESHTTNNCRMTQRITVPPPPPPPPPDLTVLITAQTPYPASPAIGGRFSLPVAVHNTGREAGRVSLRFYRSDSAAFTSSGTQVGLKEVSMGLFISTLSTTEHLDTPSSTGTYYFRVCADAVAGESDTTNNCSSAVTVTVSHSEPNLVIESTRHWGSNSMFVQVENVGSRIDEAKRWLRFYRSTDATITTSDTEIGSAERSWILVSDGFDYFYDTNTITLPATPGTYYFGACVAVAARERDTTDNCSQRPLVYHR